MGISALFGLFVFGALVALFIMLTDTRRRLKRAEFDLLAMRTPPVEQEPEPEPELATEVLDIEIAEPEAPRAPAMHRPSSGGGPTAGGSQHPRSGER